MNKLVEIFCDVDDFSRVFIPELEKQLIADGSQKRQRSSCMSMSEIMTIIIAFHMSHHHDFKNYYIGFISTFYKKHFPHLLSYTQYLKVMPRAIIPLSSYFSTLKGESTGIEFIESTSIKVCHNLALPWSMACPNSKRRHAIDYLNSLFA